MLASSLARDRDRRDVSGSPNCCSHHLGLPCLHGEEQHIVDRFAPRVDPAKLRLRVRLASGETQTERPGTGLVPDLVKARR